MKYLIASGILLLGIAAYSQSEKPITLETTTGNIEGSLLMPDSKTPVPVALLIAGSGPTDRNGNNPRMTNNSLKMIAEELAAVGIASVRYDKRGIAASKDAGLTEEKLKFDDYVNDARGWIDLLVHNKDFNSVIVIGHSEGSLIGMMAAQGTKVAKFISLAGAGRPADLAIREQLKAQQPVYLEKSGPIMDELLKGNTVDSIPPWLNALFRPSIQPYLISWFKYDPKTEVGKLKIPVLIIQGTTDIQISVEDAKLLAEGNPDAKLVIIEGMNHILKNAEADRMKNIQTYTQPDLPLNEELLQNLLTFIK